MKLGLALLALIALTISPFAGGLFTGTARAHGDAKWIMESQQTQWCCGPRDCERLPRDSVRYEVTSEHSGWRVTWGSVSVFWQDDERRGKYRVGPPRPSPYGGPYYLTYGLYDSPDDHFWMCWRDPQTKRLPRCLFVPSHGS